MRKIAASLGVSMALAGTGLAWADPNDYVVTPKVDVGEKEVDVKSGVQRNKDGSSDMAHSLGLGYGLTNYWFSEVYAKYKREGNGPQAFDAWEWENKFQLTKASDFALIGFLLEIEKPKDATEGYELTYGPLIQKEWARVQYNFNVLIQRHIKTAAPYVSELHYQAQIKYKESPTFQWGAQAFGNFGDYQHFSPKPQQEQKFGPAVFGKINLPAHQGIKWNAALLKGLTDATPTSTFRLQVEYEYY